jgi:hypothetical protein
MPRYFFHLYNDVEARDPDGTELPNVGAARMAALHDVRFTVAETIKAEGRFVGDHRIDIEDSDGNVVDTIYFRDAVKIQG